MQVACFVFIKRRWAEDKEHMENMLDYFCDIREPLQLLLFPEGTDLTGETKRCLESLLKENCPHSFSLYQCSSATRMNAIVSCQRKGNHFNQTRFK